MAIKAKASITLVRVNDGNSITNVTNFYKVSPKASGETAPQTSGGRNLAKRTNEGSFGWGIHTQEGNHTVEDYVDNGIKCVKMSRDSAGPGVWYYVSYDYPNLYALEADTEYTVSLELKPNIDINFKIRLMKGDGLGNISDTSLPKTAYANKWNKISFNIRTIKKLQEVSGRVIYFIGLGGVPNSVYYIKNLKLEKGTAPTPWTPAPEDFGWSTNIPTMTPTNKHLWNYEMVEGSDGSVISYSKPAVIGVYGDKGNTGPTGEKGPQGATGNGIQSITEYYQISSSNTVIPTSWITTVPTLTPTNKYLWNYEKITYTNGTSIETSKRVIGVYGDKGQTGAQGPIGPQGNSITSVTNFYKVTSTKSGVTAQNEGGRNLIINSSFDFGTDRWTKETGSYSVENDGTYGKCLKFSPSQDSRVYNNVNNVWVDGLTYSYSFVAKAEVDGVQLWPSRSVSDYGNNHTITTAWRKYEGKITSSLTAETGTLSFTTRYPNSMPVNIYITRIKLELGTKVTPWTPAPEDLGWSTSVPSLTASNKYLWNYETIEGSDGSAISHTKPAVIGVYGDKGNTGSTGATGNGIKNIVEHYQVSTSNTSIPTSWVTSPPALTSTNKYLWNYETINYTNGTSIDTAKRVIGVYGDKGNTGATGATGKGVAKTEVFYYLSTSNTTQTGGSWVTTPPAWVNGKYYWQKIKSTYTDGTTSESTPVCITGQKGQNGTNGATGATGQGVSSITTQFYVSTSKTTQTGGSWVETMPTWSVGKYLWTRSKVVYINPSKTVYTAPICDSSWEAVNDIQIGGRNYVKNGNFASVIKRGGSAKNPDTYPKYWNGYNPDIDNPTTSFHAHVDTNTFPYNVGEFNESDGTRQWKGFSYYFNPGELPHNSNYRLSCDLYATGEGCYINGGLYYYKKGSTSQNFYAGRFVLENSKINEWERLSVALPLGKDADLTKSSYLYIYGFGFKTNSILYIKNISLNIATNTTDWTPAPEEVQEEIEKVRTEYKAELNVERDRITSTVKQVTTVENKAIAAQNTANNALSKTDIKDTRNDNENPKWYMLNYPRQMVNEFKFCSTIGLPSSSPIYCYLTTTVPWSDASGGYPKQVAKLDGAGGEYYRYGVNDTTWSAWTNSYNTAKDAVNKAGENAKKISENKSAITQLSDSITHTVQKVEKVEQTANSANEFANNAKNNYGYQYKYNLILNGDPNIYYPIVLASGDQDVSREILVTRAYYEQAPADWNGHPTSKGISLNLKIKCNFGGWGGANYSWFIHDLEELYGNVFAGAAHCMSDMGFAIFLRGGGTTGAKYHIYSDQALETTQVNGMFPKIGYNKDLIGYYGGNGSLETATNKWYAPEPRTYTEAVKKEIASKKYIDSAISAKDGVDNLAPRVEATETGMSGMNEVVVKSQSTIQQLSDSISHLVQDENGSSLMQQKGDEFIFNFSPIQKQINKAVSDAMTANTEAADAKDLANKTNQLANDIAKKTAYINMSTDDSGAPCIELGKSDNPFKLRITNTSIDFMEGSNKIAYITNQKLYIQSSVVTDQMQVGEGHGFIWKKRANGNMGLRRIL